MITQELRGFVGQGMSGARLNPVGHLHTYSAGSHTFTVPREGAGRWRFVLWGGGGTSGPDPGGGGALAIKDVHLGDAQKVTLVVGGVGQGSTVALPQTTVVAGPGVGGSSGVPGSGGTATAGDVNVAGAPGSGTAGGASGSFGEFRGGAGGGGIGSAGRSPGGGAGAFSGTGLQEMAASGLVLVYRISSN